MSENESEEYKDGYLAFMEGLELADNPYKLNEIAKRWDWTEGFIDARDRQSDGYYYDL